ncbi:MAG TPA: hypothetical protein VEA19_00485 [Actinomycetota bacterium]|nr:hypothetical protein [Actinomycetota bacterium]
MDPSTKRAFFVKYEEGGEPVYAFMRARTRAEIYMRLPEVRVLDRPPGWLEAHQLEALERDSTFDVDEDPASLLERLRARR